jgi:hypothetical protein
MYESENQARWMRLAAVTRMEWQDLKHLVRDVMQVVHRGGAVGGRAKAPRLPDDVEAGLREALSVAPCGAGRATFHKPGFVHGVVTLEEIYGMASCESLVSR